MQRRTILTAALLTAGLAAVAGCADASTEAAAPPLTVWADEDRVAALTELAATYTEQTGVPVDVVGRDVETIRDAYLQAVDDLRGPDVLIGAHDWIGELATAGTILPLTLPDESAFVPAAVSAMAYDELTYGVPLSTENVALVRNDALAATTPETFAEVVAQGEALVDAGHAEHPVLIQQTEAASDPYHLYALQTSFGAPVLATNEDGSYSGELALGGDAGRAFAELLAELGDAGVLDAAITADVAREAFLAGRSPYMLTGPWYANEFVEAGLDVTVLPVPPAGDAPAQPFVGVQGAFINAVSRQPALAHQFVTEFLSGVDAQLALYESSGRAPALDAALARIDDPVVTGFAAAGADGAPMPSVPQMSVVWTYWGITEHAIVRGSADPAAAWDEMVTSIEGALADQ